MTKSKKKPREEIIEGIIEPKNGVAKFEYDFHSELITFKDATIISAKMGTSYKRNSGKLKKTNSTPLASEELPFNVDKALRNNFDLLVAIDTNTRIIDGKKVSVTMSYYVEKPLSFYRNEIPISPGASYLFLNPKTEINSEKLGWHKVISNNINLNVLKKYRIGLIVDCDLGVHEAINSRKVPYFKNYYLPKNMQLIYASSDSTSDSLQNLMISYCDKNANKIMSTNEVKNIIHASQLGKNSEYCDYCLAIFSKTEGQT